ncbi:MAG: hypothetical protein GX881_01765 [Firmicutes bacterium]|nr:hypothetical protein [Bacillota bacterium]
MIKMLRWGLSLLIALAMALVFAAGCAPAEDVDEIDNTDFEEWDEEGFIDDLEIDPEEEPGEGAGTDGENESVDE